MPLERRTESGLAGQILGELADLPVAIGQGLVERMLGFRRVERRKRDDSATANRGLVARGSEDRGQRALGTVDVAGAQCTERGDATLSHECVGVVDGMPDERVERGVLRAGIAFVGDDLAERERCALGHEGFAVVQQSGHGEGQLGARRAAGGQPKHQRRRGVRRSAPHGGIGVLGGDVPRGERPGGPTPP